MDVGMDDYGKLLARNYARSFGLGVEPLLSIETPPLNEVKYEELKSAMEGAIEGIEREVNRYYLELLRCKREERRDQLEEEFKERYREVVRKLVEGISSLEVPDYGKNVTIFARDPVPIDLHPSMRQSDVGFIPSDYAEDLLLSSLLSMERMISPIPSVMVASPGPRGGIREEMMNDVVSSIDEALRSLVKWPTIMKIIGPPFDLLPPMMMEMYPDLVVVLAHGSRDGYLLGYARRLGSREFSGIQVATTPFMLIIACEGWYAMRGAAPYSRGLIVSRWSVLADSSVELAKRIVAEMSSRKILELLRDLRAEDYESNSSFILLGPSCLRYEPVSVEEYAYAEHITNSILSIEGVSKLDIDERVRRALVRPMLESIWEGMRELRERGERIPFLYASLSEMGNSYGMADMRAEAAESFEEALRLRPDFEDAWYNILTLGFAHGLNPSGILEGLYRLSANPIALTYPILASLTDDFHPLKSLITEHLILLHKLGLRDLSPLLDELEKVGVDRSRICEALKDLARETGLHQIRELVESTGSCGDL